MTHELKVHSEYFGVLQSGLKTFEVRKNDRNYIIGDILMLREFNPETEFYTGNVLTRRVDYLLLGGQFGIQKDYCVMGLSKY